MTRRYDLDALRVFAFALLILYHASGVYEAGSDFHIVSSYQYEWIDWVRIVPNRWRMPLLFLISGAAIALFQPERAPWRFALSRTWRLMLPLIFGMFFVVSIQAYCQGVTNGGIEPGFAAFLWRYVHVHPWPGGEFTGAEHGITWNHLWYLPYLWLYTLVLLALLPLLRSSPVQRVIAVLTGLRGPWLMILPALPFLACLVFLQPRFPSTHALFGDWYNHAEYFTAFLYGYALARAENFWAEAVRLRWKTLIVALVSITLYLLLRAAGRYLPVENWPSFIPGVYWWGLSRVAHAMYEWTALMTILAWAHVWLNRPMRWLPYATEAVYPWYILHQTLIVLIAYWLVPMHLGPWIESGLVIGGTIAGCLLLHEFVIRRVFFLRPLFGLKMVGADLAAIPLRT